MARGNFMSELFLVILLSFSFLPSWAYGWKISGKGCNCKIVPASFKHKLIRSLVITNDPEKWNNDFVDLKTGEYYGN